MEDIFVNFWLGAGSGWGLANFDRKGTAHQVITYNSLQ